MPETKVQHGTTARRATTARRRPVESSKGHVGSKKRTAEGREHERASAVGRTTDLSEEVLKSLE
jgi:hypothetical protein